MSRLTDISRDSVSFLLPVYHYPLTYYFSDTFSGEATNGLSNTFLNEATGAILS